MPTALHCRDTACTRFVEFVFIRFDGSNDSLYLPFFAVTFTNKRRKRTFQKMLYNQICEAAGGPCKYEGKNMKQAHKGMKIQGEHFDALVAALVKALDKFEVPETEKNEILAVLGPMKSDIVEQQ